MVEFFNSTIQRVRHLQMRAMVMVVSYSGFGGIAVDAPGSMPVHRLQSLLKLPIGDRLIAEAIFGHLEIGRPFLEATFTDLAEGFGMAARRRIRARHAAMTVFDASKKYAVRPSDSCGNKLASHNRSSTLWRNEWGANQQTVRRQHTCVRRGAASVQSRRYHKNLLCAEWAAQWCTERPPLGTPTPGQALASYPGSVSTSHRRGVRC